MAKKETTEEKKVIKSISTKESIWNKLKLCTPNISEFFEEQALIKINNLDDLDALELRKDLAKHRIKQLEKEIEQIETDIEYITNLRAENDTNKKVLDKALETVKRVVENEGSITYTRLKFIANKNIISIQILAPLVEKEGIKIHYDS